MKRFLRIQRVSDGQWFDQINDDGILWTPDIEDANEMQTAHLKTFFEFYKGDPYVDLRFRWFRRGKAKRDKDILRAIEALGAANEHLDTMLRLERQGNLAAERRIEDLRAKGQKLWEALNARMTEEDKAEAARTGKLPWGDIVP